MKFLFIADPFDKLKPKGDTSLVLLRESLRRGHEVYWATDQDVSYGPTGISVQATQCLSCEKDQTPKVGKTESLPLSSFQVGMIRKDPPFDTGYTKLCWLLKLEQEKVYFMNHPGHLVAFHEKLLPLEAVAAKFLKPTDIIPTFIGDLTGAQASMRKHSVSEVVVKPFLGFGGRDIQKIPVKQFLDWGKDTPGLADTIFQPFQPEIAEGDRRVFFLNGEILAHFMRMPAPGGYVSNLAQGGTAKSKPLGEKEHEALLRLGKFLKAAGIHLAGADVIGDKISEVNVTSPTGLRSIEALEGADHADSIIQFAEKCAFYGR